jgi:hypothetical protein
MYNLSTVRTAFSGAFIAEQESNKTADDTHRKYNVIEYHFRCRI